MAEEETTEVESAKAGSEKSRSKKSKAMKAKKPVIKTAKKAAGKTHSGGSGESEGSLSPKTVLGVIIGLCVLYLIYSLAFKAPTTTTTTTPVSGATGQPDMTAVSIITLNDVRCGKDCDLSNLIGEIKKILPNAQIKELDVNSEEGKRIFDASGLTLVPVVLFDKSVQGTKAYADISRFMEPAGEYLNLRIGANWDPYCDPSQEHCSDSKCAARLSCRKAVPGKLDLFVMSQCPYGVQALNSMKEVLAAFKGEISFSVGYIGQTDEKGNPMSLHGQGEVDEDMRELCAKKLYPENFKYMDYVWCRNAELQSTLWEKCANSSGMDASAIKSCVDSDGKKLLLDSFKETEALNMIASPTFLINNQKVFNAVTAADIKDGVCGVNPGLKGCSASLSNQSAVPAGGSCG